MKRIIRLNESDIKNIVRSVFIETVDRDGHLIFDDPVLGNDADDEVYKNVRSFNGTELYDYSLVDKFADTITNLDSNSARFVAYELYRDADENMDNVMLSIIERMDPTPNRYR